MPEHVSDAQIQALVEGSLPMAERETVERHLEECEACLQRLAAWGDRVAEELAIGGPAGDGTGELPSDLLEQLRRAADGGDAAPPGEKTRVTTELELAKTIEGKEKRIGTGGVGAVFEYTDTRFGRPVAIKVLKDGRAAAPAHAARFRREMELTASIDHPGCPTVYGSGTTADGRDFYLMQLITGSTLEAIAVEFHADGRGQLHRSHEKFRRLLELFRQVCQVIAAAHERKIIHRDLKPANVCVHGDGRPVVLDWGLAKRRDAADKAEDETAAEPTPADASHDATHDGTVIGTLQYMAPEQARGDLRASDERTDVFGLGAILHELLTGQPPHAKLAEQFTSGRELLQAIGRGEGGDLAGVPRELASICGKALAAEPAARYASPGELASDVDRWLAGFEVSAHRYSMPGRIGLAVRRRPLAYLFGTIASLLLVSAAVTASLFANQAQTQRRLAEQRFDSALKARLEMVTDVQEELALEGNTGLAREKLLNRAIDGIERLIDEAEEQPGAELVVIQARLELAHLERRERKNWKEARDMYAAIATDLRASGLAEHNALQFHKLLGDAEKKLAESTHDLDGTAAARPLFDAWHRDTQHFHQRFPNEPVAAMMLSQSHTWQGRLAQESGPSEWSAAEQHFQAALDTITPAKPPADKQSQYLYQRLIALAELASLLDDQKKFDKAIDVQKQLVAEMTELARREPTRFHRLGLIQDQEQLGLFYKHQGNHAAAVQTLSAALGSATDLAADFPNDEGVRHIQWYVQLNLGTAYRAAGQPRRAIELVQPLARRLDEFNLQNDPVDALDDQAEANDALARALADDQQPATAAEHFLVSAQFRAAILRRDAADASNLRKLLAATQATCKLASSLEKPEPVCEAIAAICQQVETLDPEKNFPADLRSELASVYDLLAAARRATTDK